MFWFHVTEIEEREAYSYAFLKDYSTIYDFFIKLCYICCVTINCLFDSISNRSERDGSFAAMGEENKAPFIQTKRAVPNCFSHALKRSQPWFLPDASTFDLYLVSGHG